MKTQRQTFRNDSGREIEVYVEAWPERYLLKPNDEMEIETETVEEGRPVFGVVVTDRGLQIYPATGTPERVWINGQPAQENWDGVT